MASRGSETYQRRKARGVCTVCGVAPPRLHRTACRPCALIVAARSQAGYQRHRLRRIQPDYTAPDGYRYEAVVDTQWRLLAPGVTRRCRAHRGDCGRVAEAELNRPHKNGRENWWAYCGQHLYGRWIEHGQVMGWRLIANEAKR